ncbi:MAG: VWA domain-containing protein, partial [Solirubrobacterales bacterium]|nr:VWA domain-containing protein [Solirubrobacterales bacterium]
RDLAELDPEELARARALLRNLGRRGPTRVSRRVRPSPRRGPRPDLPRTVRAAMRHGGEPVQRRWRAPGRTPRTLVFVVDVSGSMAAYADALLAYVEGAVVARRRVEAFALGTRLTHVTHELRVGGVARVREAVADWAGGTRIGEGLATLTRRYGGRVGRGAVVVVLSDGWDRGEPELVAAEMERLHRVAHRVVWLNPLKARPGYEPLARGMAAALPFVDDFLAGHSLGAMEELATRLEAAG